MSKSAKFIIPIVLMVLIGLIFFLPKNHKVLVPEGKTLHPAPYTLTPTTLFLAGDIMLSRNVADKIYKTRNFSLPFEKVAKEVSEADIAFANLESPFGDSGKHSVQNSLVFNADPEFVSGLVDAGFDILSTANNHASDQGEKGLEYTLETLFKNHISPIGTGNDCHGGTIMEVNSTKFGFLAYSYAGYNDGGKKPNKLVCSADDSSQVSQDIKNLKPIVDVLIVSMHAGTEYTRTPNQMQTNFAHNAIDSGADLVVGAHPHWVQTIEQYQGKWIFYSLGNFVFDQMWSTDTRQGLTVKISLLNKKIKKIELNPVIIDDFCCARWANSTETKSILGTIGLTSTVLVDNN